MPSSDSLSFVKPTPKVTRNQHQKTIWHAEEVGLKSTLKAQPYHLPCTTLGTLLTSVISQGPLSYE